MASFSKAAVAGNANAWLGFIDSNGFMVGSTTSAPAQTAAGSGMIALTGIKEAAPTVPEQEVVQSTGDDTVIAEFDFSNTTSRSFVAEFAVGNLDLDALLQGTLVETVGEAKMTGLDVLNPAELNVCVIIQSRAKKQDAGVVGQKGWSGIIIPIASAKPLGRGGFSERSPGSFRLQITPQTAGNHPWGVTIAEANAGTTGQKFTEFDSEYPLTMHAHTGNGALQTFTLDKKPISPAKTAILSNRNSIATASVSTSLPYSFTTSATAPIGGSQIVTLYEYDA